MLSTKREESTYYRIKETQEENTMGKIQLNK